MLYICFCYRDVTTNKVLGSKMAPHIHGKLGSISYWKTEKMTDSDEETTTDHQLKFVLLGDGASGKVRVIIEFRDHFSVRSKASNSNYLREFGLQVGWKLPIKSASCDTLSFADINMCKIFSGELWQSLQTDPRTGFLSGKNCFTRFVSKLEICCRTGAIASALSRHFSQFIAHCCFF